MLIMTRVKTTEKMRRGLFVFSVVEEERCADLPEDSMAAFASLSLSFFLARALWKLVFTDKWKLFAVNKGKRKGIVEKRLKQLSERSGIVSFHSVRLCVLLLFVCPSEHSPSRVLSRTPNTDH